MKHTPLNTIDSKTLMATELPPLRFVVSELLPQGLHILAGAPKVGKSWLALWLCLCVAKGESAWGFPTGGSGVLYLCLEDSYARLKRRLEDVTDEGSERLILATVSEKLHRGLEEQIEDCLASRPDVALIVIDTLQRIRDVTNDANAYASDYRDLGTLKTLADKHGVAILLIHHLRKMHDDDPMNMISGTTGISGAADSTFVLQRDSRGENSATLYCTGRDIEYRELPLAFDPDAHVWQLRDEDTAWKPRPSDRIIASLSVLLHSRGSFSGTATELAEALEPYHGEPLLPNVLMKHLVRYEDTLRRNGIAFESHRTRDRREVFLSLLCDGNDDNDGKPDTAAV